MKKYIALFLAVLCITSCFASCKKNASPGSGSRLSFAEAINMDRINELSGKTVEIVGYMAKVSPTHGKFMYLMNLPYQTCPYCVPNTQQLSNTIAVYAPDGDKFEFTDAPINVVGTLETGDFEDELGYTYNYRIKDAVYTQVTSDEATEVLALWERISNIGLSADVYSMFDYIDFECNWQNYTGTDADGNTFYLYPADVDYFETTQYADYTKEDYFTTLVKHAKSIGDPVMDELISIIGDAEALVNEAKSDRAAGKYTYDEAADQYALETRDDLLARAQDLYTRYAYWLENFSLSN